MASPQSLPLQSIVTICDSLGSFADKLMEPNSLVMVIGRSGGVTFSRLASRVLREMHHSHPLEKIILNATSAYCRETGDDCKVFLLLVKEIMNATKDLLKTSHETDIRRTLSKEIFCLMSFLPDILRMVRGTFARSSQVHFSSSPRDLEGLVLTFFESKFSLNVSTKLSQLVCTFLSRSISDSSCATNTLNYIISNFRVLCSKVISPVSESGVIRGFILQHRLPANLTSSTNVSFIVTRNLFQKSDDVCWSADAKSLPQQLGCPWGSVEKLLRFLKSQMISLLLTSDGLCEDFESLCSRCEILAVSRVPQEDIDNIIHCVNISPLASLRDILHPENIGHLEAVEPILLGGVSFIHLKTSEVGPGLAVPNHIILCASLEEVWEDYYTECQNCLRTVKKWLCPQPRHSNEAVNSSKGMAYGKCPEIQNCAWNDSNWLLDVLTTDISGGHNASIPCALGIAYPVGLFEFALRTTLAGFHKDKFSSMRVICDILDSALLRVLCKLWNITVLQFEGEKGYKEFYNKMKNTIAVPIEPASNKEDQIYRVLQVVQQLIRIDAVLSIK